MTEGQSGVDVLLKTINNEAMTNLTGTSMYMSPEQYRFSYSDPGNELLIIHVPHFFSSSFLVFFLQLMFMHMD